MDTVVKTLKSDKGENFNPNIQKSETYFIELEKEKWKVLELEKEIEELQSHLNSVTNKMNHAS